MTPPLGSLLHLPSQAELAPLLTLENHYSIANKLTLLLSTLAHPTQSYCGEKWLDHKLTSALVSYHLGLVFDNTVSLLYP